MPQLPGKGTRFRRVPVPGLSDDRRRGERRPRLRPVAASSPRDRGGGECGAVAAGRGAPGGGKAPRISHTREFGYAVSVTGTQPGACLKYSAMNWLTWMFLAALAAETATRLWLASRQIDAVIAHRDRVPEAFQAQIALADQQKAADYTLARVRLGRWATVVESLIKVGFTLGGGLAAV